MDRYTNDKGEVVIIAEMDSNRLINAIAKYSRRAGALEATGDNELADELIKALKAEAIRRLA